MDRKRKIIVLIILCAILGILIYPYTYGGEGNLEVTVSLEKSKMSINETIHATITVKNVDDHPIRVMGLERSIWVFLKYSNGSVVEYTGPLIDMAPPINFELVMLKPGESVSRNESISCLEWNLKNNSTHMVYANLHWSEKISFLLNLPHWQGNIVSDGFELKVN
jgi:hypothetical protein